MDGRLHPAGQRRGLGRHRLRKPIYNANGSPLYGADLPGQTWKLFMDTYLKGQKHKKLATSR